eukprot:gb/GEZN01007787.1/.p1 GENE.gb/GEZN01007787.1/~~gb/GEZN01007787.1/.p1  ORF type:complete len:426 (-),score=39.79 gb/GEZN01007787.1/:134-1411(-)
MVSNRCYGWACFFCWLCAIQGLLVPFLLLYLRGPVYLSMAPLETRTVSPETLWCKELVLYESGHLYMFTSLFELPPLDVRVWQMANLSLRLPRPSPPVYYYEDFYQHLNEGSEVQFNVCPIKGSAAGSATLQIQVFAGKNNFDSWRTESGAWDRYFWYETTVFTSSPTSCQLAASWVNVSLTMTLASEFYFVVSNSAPDTTSLQLNALIMMNKTEYNVKNANFTADCEAAPTCQLGWRTSDKQPVAIVRAPDTANGTVDSNDFPYFTPSLSCSPDALMYISVFGLGGLGLTLLFLIFALLGAKCLSLGPWTPSSDSGVRDLYDALNDDGCIEVEQRSVGQDPEEGDNSKDEQQAVKASSVNSPKEKEQEDSKDVCGICMARKKNAVLVPCGHLYACIPCSRKLRTGNMPCPLCRKPIRSVLRVFS